MFDSKKIRVLAISTFASALLVGCGSVSSTDTSVATGYYIDSAVEGVNYQCGNQNGTTDSNGKFTFEKGQDCQFSIGTLVLRSISTTILSDGIKVLENNPQTAQLLQSLDSDGNADNGITIPPEAHATIEEDGITTLPKDEITINTLVTKIKQKNSNFQGRFVSQEEAQMHVLQTRMNLDKDKRRNHNMDGMGDNTQMQEKMKNMMGAPASTTLADFNYTAFSKPLAIPALAPYTTDANGTKVFDLSIQEGETNFFKDINTTTYGINANILGQTIRMHNGDKIKLNYTNNLSVPTTMHGHGMHVPAIMDGGPVNAIQPGATWSAEYTVNQTACTNWYHPHFMHKTSEHVYMGLAGFIIIDDAQSDALNLPKEYGIDDIPLAIQDKRFDENGQIDYSPTQMETRMGYRADIMLVNGVILPYENVPAKKIRFRVLNGSNASIYKLKFSDERTFDQIATDNAFLEAPVSLNTVSLTPGERAEIVVDFSAHEGESVTLIDTVSGNAIMKINIIQNNGVISEVPDTLTTLTKPDVNASVRTRKFVLNMAQGEDGKMHMAINGKLMDIKRIDEYVPQDDIEVWEITNMMGMEHNFHIHGTHFFPLTRNGVAVEKNEQGYKDVVALPGHATVKVIVKMTDFITDTTLQANGAKIGYMYHCHFLEHEDDGMMGQFAITDGKADVNVRP